MANPVIAAYQRLDEMRPLVRPTYNQFEVTLLPPYGDPEVNLAAEVGTYLVVGLLVNAITERLYDE
jgi:hypothetical protein